MKKSWGDMVVIRTPRMGAWLATTMLVSLTASPAWAQLAPPAPTQQMIDGNGVDLFHGTMNVDVPLIEIGSGDAGGLKYYKINRGAGWSDNILASINKSGSVLTVSFGDTSEVFNLSGSTYAPQENNGSKLVLSAGIYIYTRSDGTEIRFNKSYHSEGPYYSNEGRVTQILSPSGNKLQYAYETLDYCRGWSPKLPDAEQDCNITGTAYRVTSVRNSYGYALAFSYGAIPPFDPNDEDDQPDLMTWSNPVGVTASNLAAAAGSGTQSAAFATTYAGAVATLTATDPVGRQTKYRMDGTQVAGITLPGSTGEDITVSFASGKVASVATPAGATTYAWSDTSAVRTATVTNALSNVTTYRFNIASQRLTSVTPPVGGTTSWQYDSEGRVTRITRPDSSYTQLTYDARGNVTETRHVSKTPDIEADIVTTATYPADCTNAVTCNQPTSSTDALGAVTDYTYDPGHGGLLTVTSPGPTTGAVRPQTRFTYADKQAYFRNTAGAIVASGEPVTLLTQTSRCQTLASCTGTADEVKTVVDYGPQTNGVGNNLLPVAVTRSAGDGSLTATTAYAYDAIGNRVGVDGVLPETTDTTKFRFDAARQLVGVIAPDPDAGGPGKHVAQRITYNPKGQVSVTEVGTVDSQSDADWAAMTVVQSGTTSFDAAHRPVKSVITADGTTISVAQASYDAIGRVDCAVQRMDPAQWASQTDACTPQTIGPFGPDRVTRRIYDAANRITQVQTAVGTPDAANEQTIAYQINGKPTYVIDAENNRTSYTYDGFARLLRTRYPVATKGANVSSSSDYEELSYDAGSNVIQRRLRDGQIIGYGYDRLGRLTSKNLPGSEPDATYAYDLLGRAVSAVQGGQTLTFTHDALGRNTGQSGPLGAMTFGYDIAGRRTSMTYPGGTALTINYDYNVNGNMTKIRENGATSGEGVLASYLYDALGRRKSVTYGNGAIGNLAYNSALQLATLSHNLPGTDGDHNSSYSYNPAGQIDTMTRSKDVYAWTGHVNVDRAYGTNGRNQLTSAGATALGYDARGNLTTSGTDTYGYSSENFLTSAPNGLTLAYDPVGRLYQAATPAITTRFAWNGDRMVAEYNAANVLQRRYVHGPGVDEPVVWYEGATLTDKRWLMSDERGSIISVTNGAGTVLGINRYDEYGIYAPTNLGRFQYTGQMLLPEAGLYHYKARAYSPTLGRFLQTDPIGYGDGMNFYNYVGSDPVNATDPSGLAQDRRDRYGNIFRLACVNGECDWEGIGNDGSWLTDYFRSDGFGSGGGDGISCRFSLLANCVDDRREIIVKLPRPRRPQIDDRFCGINPRLGVGGTFGGTFFLGDRGFSLNVEIGTTVLSLERGAQFYASINFSGYGGLGAYAGGGGGLVGNYSNAPMQSGLSYDGLHNNGQPVYAAGAAWGPGGEVQVSRDGSGGTASAALHGGYGAYLGEGYRKHVTLATPPLGCP